LFVVLFVLIATSNGEVSPANAGARPLLRWQSGCQREGSFR